MREEERNIAINEKISEIEEAKNDSTRMFRAVRVIQSNTPKKPLLVQTESVGVRQLIEPKWKSSRPSSRAKMPKRFSTYHHVI